MKFKNGSKIKDIPSKEKIKGFGTKNLSVDVSFEEEILKQFPSFNQHHFELREYCRTCVQFVAHLPQINHSKHQVQINLYLRPADVMVHCLDKQKVEEVIDKLIPLDEKCANNMILNNEFKKELELM